MAKPMPDRMTMARRLVLRLAQTEERDLAKRRMDRARRLVRLLAVEDEKQLQKFRFRQRLAPSKCSRITHDEVFHGPQKVSDINKRKGGRGKDYNRQNEIPKEELARTMMVRSMTSRDLAERMEGDPLRNLVLLRLLFASDVCMGPAIASRIAAALEGA